MSNPWKALGEKLEGQPEEVISFALIVLAIALIVIAIKGPVQLKALALAYIIIP